MECSRQALIKEDSARLDGTFSALMSAPLTVPYLSYSKCIHHLPVRVFRTTHGADCPTIVSMRLNDLLFFFAVEASAFRVQIVRILREHSMDQSFLLQQADEVMGGRCE